MKTKEAELIVWAFVAGAPAAMFAWALFHRVGEALDKPGVSRAFWLIPLVVLPVCFLTTGAALRREKSHRVRLWALRWLSLFLPFVAAPIVLTEEEIGLARYLSLLAASVAFQVWGSFWSRHACE